MSWIIEHKRVWRMAILALFLIAIVGPWAFDRISVPSKYSCSAPFIRLKGDFCGTPLSGMWILSAFVGEFVHLVVGLVTGANVLSDVGREFLFIPIALFLLLPFFSTLMLILPGERQRLPVFHVAVWGLAAVSTLWLLLSASELPPGQSWGLWLYIGLAPSALVLEAVALAIRRRSSQAR